MSKRFSQKFSSEIRLLAKENEWRSLSLELLCGWCVMNKIRRTFQQKAKAAHAFLIKITRSCFALVLVRSFNGISCVIGITLFCNRALGIVFLEGWFRLELNPLCACSLCSLWNKYIYKVSYAHSQSIK